MATMRTSHPLHTKVVINPTKPNNIPLQKRCQILEFKMNGDGEDEDHMTMGPSMMKVARHLARYCHCFEMNGDGEDEDHVSMLLLLCFWQMAEKMNFARDETKCARH